MKDESVTACHKILSSVKNEIASTFQSFKSLMGRMQGPPAALTMAASLPALSEPSQVGDGEDWEEDYRSQTSSQVYSGSVKKGTPPGGLGHRLTLDEVDDLLKAIYETLEIEKEVQLSQHYLLCLGLNAKNPGSSLYIAPWWILSN